MVILSKLDSNLLTHSRFPATTNTNGKGKAGRGIGSHTDYGKNYAISEYDFL